MHYINDIIFINIFLNYVYLIRKIRISIVLYRALKIKYLKDTL